MKRGVFFLLFSLLMTLCVHAEGAVWNNPYKETGAVIRYSSFSSPPRTLDPAKAYSSNELQFIAQIYEPLLEYSYFKRPYQLTPLVAKDMPTVTYYDKNGKKLPSTAEPSEVAESVYDIHIKPGIVYQQHPAFAKDQQGHYWYHHLTDKQLQSIKQLSDFKEKDTRELVAADYAYAIKRLAAPWVHSPIAGVMSQHIVGFAEYSKYLEGVYQQVKKETGESTPYVDLLPLNFAGVNVLGRYHFQIRIKGIYRQFQYWLAMPFFAPMPDEAVAFYSQPGLSEHNISLGWYPVGTGPYEMTENNPNYRIVLQKNPMFRKEAFPQDFSENDRERGYVYSGKHLMPFVDAFHFYLEKESIPRWNKFMQGYYDQSGISAESFDQAITMDGAGSPSLTDEMKEKGIHLETTVAPAVYYFGFNMLDPVVGGESTRAKYLRQAISIAVNYEEYIDIFMNGRGIAAQGPIPPGIFGFEEGQLGINNVVYDWDGHEAKRKPISAAKALMKKAGYPAGVDPKTGRSLVLHYDVATGGGPDDKARLNWMRKQFNKIGIDLNIRSTQYNRFREKVRVGNAQLFSWGWLADYPDPENFLFLLYGPNGKVKFGGENASNYDNEKVNQLFEMIKNTEDSEKRQQEIDALLRQVREDSPWIWGVHPINFTLSHQWNGRVKASAMSNNILKYQRVNRLERNKRIEKWNAPVVWPLIFLLVFCLAMFLPLVICYIKKQNRSSVRRINKG